MISQEQKDRFDLLVQNIPQPGARLTPEILGRRAHVNVVLTKEKELSAWVNAKIDAKATGWYLSGKKDRGLRCYLTPRALKEVLEDCRYRLDDLTVSELTVVDVVSRPGTDTAYLLCEVS